MSDAILEVTDVTCSIGKSNPRTLSVTAKGNVRTGGWSAPELSPYVYITPPEDGILDMDFNATKPDCPSTDAITQISANYSNSCDDWVKGVRIHAETNKKEAKDRS